MITKHKQAQPTILRASVEDTFVVNGIEYISTPANNNHRHLEPVA